MEVFRISEILKVFIPEDSPYKGISNDFALNMFDELSLFDNEAITLHYQTKTKGFRELLDNKNLLFYQKKFGEHSYEYYVRKVNNEKTR